MLVPFKITVPVPAVNTPLFVQSPPNDIVPFPEVIAPVPSIVPVTDTFVLLVFKLAVPPVILQSAPIVTVPVVVVFAPAPEKVRSSVSYQ